MSGMMTNFEKYFGSPELLSLSRIVPYVTQSDDPHAVRFVEPNDPTCLGQVVLYFGGCEIKDFPCTMAFLEWLKEDCE